MRMRSIGIGSVAGVLLPAMAFGYTTVFRSAFTEFGSSNPTGIATGDYDRDGAVDVVTCAAGAGGNELDVFIGLRTCAGGDQAGVACFQPSDCPGGMCRADGTISPAGSIPLNSFPSGLLQANFDGDAFDDLIVAKGNDNAVVFVKGLGTTDFFAPPGDQITVGQSPSGLASGDIDGDGKRDVVVANEGGDAAPGSITLLHGNGDGTFVLLQQPDPSKPGETVDSLPAELGTHAVAVGNIDADPGMDVLALNARSSSVSVFTGDGHGIFTPRASLPTGAAPQDLALVDLNNDGKLDLVVATSNEDAVTVQLGNGDRTFGAAQTYPVGTAPTRLLVADVDADGTLDIVASNSRSGDVSVLLGITPGTFGVARTFVADAEPQALALGDFNGDGLPDAVTATQGSDAGATVAVLRNRGHGTLHAVEDVTAGNGPSGLAVADLDGDGLPDLLASGDGGEVALFASRGDGFAPPALFNVGGRTLGVAARDLNGDAQPDIVVADSVNNRVAVSLSQGGGRFAAAALYSTAPGPGAITVGDFNGDGRPDLAVSAIGTDRFCQGGPQPGKSCQTDDECAPGGLCTAPGKASVLIQQPNGTFGAARNTDVEETPIGIAAIDANCDGKDDLIVANLAASTVSVLRSNASGDGSFTLVQSLPAGQVGQNPISVAVADFDGDGVDDFAVTNTVAPQATPNVHLFRGNCSGPFTAFTNGQIHIGELANTIIARDFTGDQIVDLALISQTSNDVCLLVGNGDGTVSRIGSGSCERVSRMPIALAAGDFDADGRYDVASANNDPSANNLSVLSNCARDPGCNPFPIPGRPPSPAGEAALRGDGNGDAHVSAADLVAVGREVMDNDGFQVEAIARGSYAASPGVDANGDGRVDAQDRLAVAHRIFRGA